MTKEIKKVLEKSLNEVLDIANDYVNDVWPQDRERGQKLHTILQNAFVEHQKALEILEQPPEGEFTAKMRRIYMPKDPRIAVPGEWQYIIKACDIIDSAESENRRLKKAIEDYGNNPAGFDWAVLEKIENQESIKAELLAACEDNFAALVKIKETQKIDPFYLETVIILTEAAISKAKDKVSNDKNG